MNKILIKSQLIPVLMLSIAMSTSFARADVAPKESCQVDALLNGKKSINEVVSQLKIMVKTENCKNLDKVCELRGEGDVSGVWKQHRIFLNESPIMGSNNLDGLMENVNELRSSGICQE
ncbi:MAG: hypothetical protein AABY64_14740 [Bdellovibrionota bacterium]